jgi:hypothetical protein
MKPQVRICTLWSGLDLSAAVALGAAPSTIGPALIPQPRELHADSLQTVRSALVLVPGADVACGPSIPGFTHAAAIREACELSAFVRAGVFTHE